MGSLFEISILISLFAIVNGNVVIDELKDKQTSRFFDYGTPHK